MAKYFVNPYKNYYEKLSSASSLVSDGNEIVSNVSSASTKVNELQSQLELSVWQEIGYDELVTTIVPTFKSRFDILSANVGILQQTCNEAINGLLPVLTSLKEKDELYESTINELNNLKEPSNKYETTYVKGEYVETNNLTAEYTEYENKKKELQEKITKLDGELQELVTNCDSKINAIKALSSSMKDFDTLTTGNPSEIKGLELSDTEEKLVSTLEQAMQDEDSTLKDQDTLDQTTVTNNMQYQEGQTVLLNDAGGRDAGYSRQIITSHGKLVTVFQQNWNQSIGFKDSKWTIRDAGCGYNALASVLSSKYSDVTPESVFVEMGQRYLYPSTIKTYLKSKYGIEVGSREEVPRNNYPAYRQHLIDEVSKGNMVMATVNGRTDSKYTRNSHWVAIVDYDPSIDSFYVTDSADNNDDNAGPIQVDEFLKKYSVNTNVIYIEDSSGYLG